MASLLETEVKRRVADAFRGRLLTGTLRRAGPASLNSFGDPVAGAAQEFTFEGIRDSFTLRFAEAAGVPVTDAKILVLLGSLSPATDPQQDDQVLLRGQWFQLRRKVSADPAGATQEWAGFEIEDPT
ncbi:MAG: hypothetical protein Q7T33_02665 [Dehalococcoidia bacterium]|nr:hypothetical protein [Dehalococcoidia bacterium]